METKVCSHCKRELPLAMFQKRALSKDGLQGLCKDCIREYNRRRSSKKDKPIGGGNLLPFSDPDFDGKDPGEVVRMMGRAKRWLESRGFEIILKGEYNIKKQIKF